jgi:hypothetical protein
VLGRRLDPGLDHERDMLSTLAIAPLALDRAAAQTQAVELLSAAGAFDQEALRSDRQAVRCDRPLVRGLSSVEPFTAAWSAETASGV